ncbi:hypothetical protein PV721_12450 [Streptomyces sp. MB09-01]|uniref:hypothetical protein n=1 Tax=Streptomyces sp. MB09-01 TaxID=3028666 RepID=UPI0029A8C6C6|nr:hypothetical protein [Streptomyces sp. MB09-01]MDX3535171.1 hypothetical protein [Streptomyces sp. MB09-01]
MPAARRAAVVHQRLHGREGNDPRSLRRHPVRSGELAEILDRAGVEDSTVDATAGSVAYIAASVVTAADWR